MGVVLRQLARFCAGFGTCARITLHLKKRSWKSLIKAVRVWWIFPRGCDQQPYQVRDRRWRRGRPDGMPRHGGSRPHPGSVSGGQNVGERRKKSTQICNPSAAEIPTLSPKTRVVTRFDRLNEDSVSNMCHWRDLWHINGRRVEKRQRLSKQKLHCSNPGSTIS